MIALTNGTLQLKDLRTNPTEKATLMHRSNNAIRDMKLWKKSDGVYAVLG
jgi:hypothetical protein